MAKWQYGKKTIPKDGLVDGKLDIEVLNELGDEGWEAYAAHDHGDEITYFFKRQKS